MKRIKAYLRRTTGRNRLNHYKFIAKRLTNITLIETVKEFVDNNQARLQTFGRF